MKHNEVFFAFKTHLTVFYYLILVNFHEPIKRNASQFFLLLIMVKLFFRLENHYMMKMEQKLLIN